MAVLATLPLSGRTMAEVGVEVLRREPESWSHPCQGLPRPRADLKAMLKVVENLITTEGTGPRLDIIADRLRKAVAIDQRAATRRALKSIDEIRESRRSLE